MNIRPLNVKEFTVNVVEQVTTPVTFIVDDDGRLLVQVGHEEYAIPVNEAIEAVSRLAEWYGFFVVKPQSHEHMKEAVASLRETIDRTDAALADAWERIGP